MLRVLCTLAFFPVLALAAQGEPKAEPVSVPSAPGVAPEKSLKALVNEARKTAAAWHSDAVLVDFKCVILSGNKASDLQVNPDVDKFTFVSPSTKQWVRAGVLFGQVILLPGAVPVVDRYIVPIPDEFMDLGEALAHARADGLKGDLIDARLWGQPNSNPLQPNKLYWQIEKNGRNSLIEAGTGGQIDPALQPPPPPKPRRTRTHQ